MKIILSTVVLFGLLPHAMLIYATSDVVGEPDYLQPVRRTEVKIVSISDK
jgi:hypothetical protein